MRTARMHGQGAEVVNRGGCSWRGFDGTVHVCTGWFGGGGGGRSGLVGREWSRNERRKMKYTRSETYDDVRLEVATSWLLKGLASRGRQVR